MASTIPSTSYKQTNSLRGIVDICLLNLSDTQAYAMGLLKTLPLIWWHKSEQTRSSPGREDRIWQSPALLILPLSGRIRSLFCPPHSSSLPLSCPTLPTGALLASLTPVFLEAVSAGWQRPPHWHCLLSRCHKCALCDKHRDQRTGLKSGLDYTASSTISIYKST